MRPTTHSSELGAITLGSAIPIDSTPGSAASSSMPVEIGSGVAAIDATTTWIEQLQRLPRMTPTDRSTTATLSTARSAVSTPTKGSQSSSAFMATSPLSRLLGRFGHL